MANRPYKAAADPLAVAESARVIAEVCLTRLINDGRSILDELARLRAAERQAEIAAVASRADHEAIARVRELMQTWDLAGGETIRGFAQQLSDALDPPSWDTADTLNTERSAATGLDPALTTPDLGIVGDTASYRT